MQNRSLTASGTPPSGRVAARRQVGAVGHPRERVQLVGGGALAVGRRTARAGSSSPARTRGRRGRGVVQLEIRRAHASAGPGVGTPKPSPRGLDRLGRLLEHASTRQARPGLVGAEHVASRRRRARSAARPRGRARGSSRCGRAPSTARRPSARPRSRSARRRARRATWRTWARSSIRRAILGTGSPPMDRPSGSRPARHWRDALPPHRRHAAVRDRDRARQPDPAPDLSARDRTRSPRGTSSQATHSAPRSPRTRRA